MAQRKANLRKDENNCKKEHAGQRFKKNGCTNHSLWMFGCKDCLTMLARKTSQVLEE